MKRTLSLAALCGGALAVLAFPASAEQLKTAEEAQSSSLTYAITAPLRDINIIRTKVPIALTEALTDPYRRPAVATCDGLIEEVTALNAALGDDLDSDNVKKVSLGTRAKEEALNAIAGAASDLIPFRGWVRKLTGAERHDRTIHQAITAGGIRRAYLKGLGEASGCNPPATPLHKPLNEPVLAQAETAPTITAAQTATVVPVADTAAAVPVAQPVLTKTEATGYAPY